MFVTKGASFHNLWYDEQAARPGWCVAERLLVRQSGPHFVRARHVDHRNGVSRRLHCADIQLLQFFNVAEDVIELRSELLFLGGSQFDARKVRDVSDIEFRGGHEQEAGDNTKKRQSVKTPPRRTRQPRSEIKLALLYECSPEVIDRPCNWTNPGKNPRPAIPAIPAIPQTARGGIQAGRH